MKKTNLSSSSLSSPIWNKRIKALLIACLEYLNTSRFRSRNLQMTVLTLRSWSYKQKRTNTITYLTTIFNFCFGCLGNGIRSWNKEIQLVNWSDIWLCIKIVKTSTKNPRKISKVYLNKDVNHKSKWFMQTKMTSVGFKNTTAESAPQPFYQLRYRGYQFNWPTQAINHTNSTNTPNAGMNWTKLLNNYTRQNVKTFQSNGGAVMAFMLWCKLDK